MESTPSPTAFNVGIVCFQEAFPKAMAPTAGTSLLTPHQQLLSSCVYKKPLADDIESLATTTVSSMQHSVMSLLCLQNLSRAKWHVLVREAKGSCRRLYSSTLVATGSKAITDYVSYRVL